MESTFSCQHFFPFNATPVTIGFPDSGIHDSLHGWGHFCSHSIAGNKRYSNFFHILSCIKCRTGPEPGYLLFVIRMLYFKTFFTPVLVMKNHLQRTSRSKIFQPHDRNQVAFPNLVIIGLIRKGQCNMPCFFKFVSWIRAKLFAKMTRTFKKRGSMAACSRLDPSP